MAFRDSELQRVEMDVAAFLEERRPPPEIREQFDLQWRLEGQSVFLFEVRPRWRGQPGETRDIPVAKVTYVRKHDIWKLYWMRSDLKWHDCEPTVPSLRTALVLVSEDENGCFFG